MTVPDRDNNKVTLGVLGERLDTAVHVLEKIEPIIYRIGDSVVKHEEQIKTLRIDHDSLAGRLWWLLGISITVTLAIIGLVYKGVK